MPRLTLDPVPPLCNRRDLDTTGLGVRLQAERDPEQKRYAQVKIILTLTIS